MDLIITILPVVTKDLPISPRFTPYNFLSRCKFSTLTTRQPMVEFYLLTFPRFPLRKKEHKSYFGKDQTHDFRTSRCAAYLLDHSGDERQCCLPLSLFDLIAVSLSLLHFIPLCGALVVLVLALSSYLGCLALLKYVYGCLSCPTRIISDCPGLFRFCSLFFPLLSPFLAMMPFAGYFHARFLLPAFFAVCLSYFVLFFSRPCSSPIYFGVNSSILCPQLD